MKLEEITFKQVLIILLIVLAVGIIGGFFIGRGQTVVKETHTVEYRQSEPIRINVPMPYPVKEVTTTIRETQLPGKVEYKHDTIVKIDTAAIVKDYLVQRSYSQTFFNSKEQGKLIVNAVVQYNKQQDLAIDYTPVKEIVTDTKVVKPTFTPYVGIDYNTNGYVGAGGGLYYHNIGLNYEYNYNLKLRDNYHSVGLRVKF